MSTITPPKLVFYNWAQFDDAKGRGGGVSVYLRSIIPFYLKSGYKIYFISAGCHYSVFSKKIFFEKTENIYSNDGVESYRIVNSPIKAPSQDSFFQISECLDNLDIVDMFERVLDHIGNIDEIHFHSIEGVSTLLIERLAQRDCYKLRVWFHNYHWFCPQVDLFKDDVKPCYDYASGVDCIGCLTERRDPERQKRIQSFISLFELNPLFRGKYGALLRSGVKSFYVGLKGIYSTFSGEGRDTKDSLVMPIQLRTMQHTARMTALSKQGALYKKWRSENVRRLNSYVDTCIAVSGLVQKKLVELGLDEDKILVAPLGMDVFRPDFIEFGQRKAAGISNPIRIGFLGYSKEAKGLSFFIRAMATLDEKYRSQIQLHIISNLSEQMRRRVVRLSEKFDITLTEGYVRSELEGLAETLDVAVVPPIWWETYNQVAYEMLMFGVPVIISDSAGIAEYINSDFAFASNSESALAEKIQKILTRPEMITSYWNKELFCLPSIQEHFNGIVLNALRKR